MEILNLNCFEEMLLIRKIIFVNLFNNISGRQQPRAQNLRGGGRIHRLFDFVRNFNEDVSAVCRGRIDALSCSGAEADGGCCVLAAAAAALFGTWMARDEVRQADVQHERDYNTHVRIVRKAADERKRTAGF